MIMNSAINPLVTPSQDSITGNQVNKTIHTQGTTTSYCQPSHMPQSLGNMHANTNVAHSHPNQQHHYSLNVPNTTGHYINQNMGQIPASNHPVANPSSTAAGQGCNPQKNVTNYMSNYQANLALQQNQNAFLPVSQALPASVPSQLTATTASENSERQQSEGRQSNGTPEVKSPEKKENVSSFSSAPKENNVQPAPVPQLPQIQEHAEETPTPVLTAVPTQASQLNSAEAIGAKMPTSVLLVANSKPSSSSCSDTQQTETTATTTMTANFISSTHMENNDNSAVSTSVENIIRESEFKKIDVEENSTSTEQPENLEKNKPFESDTDAELEKDKPARAVEPTVTNEEEKVSPKLQEREGEVGPRFVRPRRTEEIILETVADDPSTSIRSTTRY